MNGQTADARLAQTGRAVALCAGLLLGLLVAAESFSSARRRLEPSQPQSPSGWSIRFRCPRYLQSATSSTDDHPRDLLEYIVTDQTMILRVRRLPDAADLTAEQVGRMVLEKYAEEADLAGIRVQVHGETRFGPVNGWKAAIDKDPSLMDRRAMHLLVAAATLDVGHGAREAYTVELQAADSVAGRGQATLNAVLDSITERGEP